MLASWLVTAAAVVAAETSGVNATHGWTEFHPKERSSRQMIAQVQICNW
jgi:hypothetical protein